MGVLVFLTKNGDQEHFHNPSECTPPSKNNPFMNVLMSDYTTQPEKPEACATDSDIKKLINENFDFNLYKDTDDLFDRKNSQRQFYTNPSTTIPNDQDSFAKWLFKSQPTCKEDTIECTGNIYEKPQQNRFVFPNPNDNPVVSK